MSPLPSVDRAFKDLTPGIMIPVAASSLIPLYRPTSNKQSLRDLTLVSEKSGHVLFGCQAHPCGFLFRTALSLQLLGSAPCLPTPGTLLCLRLNSADFPTDQPSLLVLGLSDNTP